LGGPTISASALQGVGEVEVLRHGTPRVSAAIDAYHLEMLEGEYFILSHGSRITLKVLISEKHVLELSIADR